MILYLKTPQLTKFSRESILKQEEALAELDVSIDEWVCKLERAEERRNRIQQKLLQHYAAASNLPTTQTTQPVHTTGMALTPPTSPENLPEDVYSRERHDVQSIKIYADSGVAALLSAIEQEIDLAEPPQLSSWSLSPSQRSGGAISKLRKRPFHMVYCLNVTKKKRLT